MINRLSGGRIYSNISRLRKDKAMTVSVIIPAYNEEKRIEKTLTAISDFMSANFSSYEIVVVDDGSRDNTKGVCANFEDRKVKVLSYGENRGKGGAVKYGMLNTNSDFLICTDADLPYGTQCIKDAFNILSQGECDFVLGERTDDGAENKYPLFRKIMSFGFSLAVKTITGLNVPDTQCGFKAFTKACAHDIFGKTTISGWGFDVEAIFIAIKKGYHFKRLKVVLSHDEAGSKVNALADSLKMLGELKKIRKNNKNKLYD